MKKMLFCLFALGTGAAYAQQQDRYHGNVDSLLPRFCIDINGMAGAQGQVLNTINYAGSFIDPVNQNIGNPKYSDGNTIGFDAQAGFFFGRKRHWGIGTGFMYLSQKGTLAVDNYHVEYQSIDYNGDVFRQSVTAGQAVKENVTMTNINIPLVLKYKHQLGRRFGFAADAGLLFNLQSKSTYTTNASFDYEAIYAFNSTGTPVYDASAVPDAAHDWLITKAQFTKTDAGSVASQFAQLRVQGYNVGLNVKPAQTGGTVSYTTGSIGLLLRPTISYKLSRVIYLDLGAYYMYQTFKNSTPASYQLTDKAGAYSSLMNSIKSTAQSSYGGNLGLRFYIGKRDKDHDGIADKKDKCPDVFGLRKFDGCPDTDGDGIADKDDRCPLVAGGAQMKGCPDTDGDGVADIDDQCPTVAGFAKFQGCPDTDGDGIPDKDDKCPTVAGLAQFQGCPDTDGDGVPDAEDHCPAVPGLTTNFGCPAEAPKVVELDLSGLVFFDFDQAVLKPNAYSLLDKIARQLTANTSQLVNINGYADNTGTKVHNMMLSIHRAQAVQQYLQQKGALPAQMKAHGYGEASPIADNDTEEGRAKNRRAEIKGSK